MHDTLTRSLLHTGAQHLHTLGPGAVAAVSGLIGRHWIIVGLAFFAALSGAQFYAAVSGRVRCRSAEMA